jgi:membrane complex biogenesis BtpA family protein
MTAAGDARVTTETFRLVGVIHLPPLPGEPLGPQARELDRVIDHARRDADAWVAGGAKALIVENFGDVPFRKSRVGPQTIAAMTLAVSAVIAESGLPVGVNVLRNDVEAAVAIAAMCGGGFVRANVYVGAAVTDQGLIEGRADRVQALIRQLAADVDVWADVDVKHAAPVARRPLGELAEDAVKRGLAKALIVTGPGTGQPTSLEDLRTVREAMPATPLYVGSGATPETLPDLLAVADGAIVGTGAKADGDPRNPVDVERVRAFVAAVKRVSDR